MKLEPVWTGKKISIKTFNGLLEAQQRERNHVGTSQRSILPFCVLKLKTSSINEAVLTFDQGRTDTPRVTWDIQLNKYYFSLEALLAP